jgi:hypothetical protein
MFQISLSKRGSAYRYTAAQRDAHEHARESFTQVAMKLLPLILRRWRSDEAVVGRCKYNSVYP